MQKNPKEKVLLLDIGTNGEMAVGNEDQIYCCATAVGSAFEGAEMAMGMPAAVGAISHVWLDQRRIRVQVIGDEEACGICGSGLIDALAAVYIHKVFNFALYQQGVNSKLLFDGI